MYPTFEESRREFKYLTERVRAYHVDTVNAAFEIGLDIRDALRFNNNRVSADFACRRLIEKMGLCDESGMLTAEAIGLYGGIEAYIEFDDVPEQLEN